jgi:hypothetical protein
VTLLAILLIVAGSAVAIAAPLFIYERSLHLKRITPKKVEHKKINIVV